MKPTLLDYLIKNATVVDGTGTAGYNASAGVKGDKIAAINTEGELPEAKDVVEAHSHIDITLPLVPAVDNNILQGITTVVAGNCGMTIAPA